MSDTSQGPGWWLASDGRWYAPELHPNYVAPPPPSERASSAPLTSFPGDWGGEDPPAPSYVGDGDDSPKSMRKRRLWPFVVGGAVLILVIGGATVAILATSKTSLHQVQFSVTDYQTKCADSSFTDGTTVTVRGDNGSQLAAGSLAKGTDSTASLTDGTSIDLCTLVATMDIPVNQRSYSFTPSNRPPITYTFSQVSNTYQWQPGETFGCPSNLQGGC